MDDIDIKLNNYLAAEKAALENWKKLKFRLLVISKFSSLKALQKKIDDEMEDSDLEDENLRDDSKPKWFIIESESRNKQVWNMFTNILYMVSFFNFPLIIGFEFSEYES